MKYEIKENGLIDFSKEDVAGKVKVEMDLTDYAIDCIICNAIEGGIGYWACLNNTGEDWEKKPKGVPASTWATVLLLEGKGVEFEDQEDGDKKHTLTLKKLLKGYGLNYKNRPHDNDWENGDATTADCIIQYALFGEVVYG